VAGATDPLVLSRAVVTATRGLLSAALCQLYRLDDGGDGLTLLASSPDSVPTIDTLSTTSVLLAALDGRGTGAAARALWPQLEDAQLLVAPLSAGAERVGLLCLGSAPEARFSAEDAELARAIAHLSAVALKRTELIDSLTKANILKDLFEALAAGAGSFAATKATEIGCDLSRPYVILVCEPIAGREHGSGEWRAAAARVGAELAALGADSAVESGPGPVRALLVLQRARADALLRECRALAGRNEVAMGISELRGTPAEAPRAYREAVDAATIGRALLTEGGAIAYSELGAYRYLVHISPDEAPHDRMRAAVDRLIDYDGRRRTALLDTLERYLAERRSVIESARSLYIHPNTLRQRLGRIEELTGLELEHDDLLSLELAIKVARMHGRQAGGERPASAPAPRAG
jgi:purine catabolism regulator